MSERLVILVTAYITNKFHETMLINCLTAVQKHYPTAYCVVLNDNHRHDLKAMLDSNNFQWDTLKVEKSPAPPSGECNAYIWAAEHADEYDTFIYIHDSVILLNPIPEIKENTIWNPLWYAHNGAAQWGMQGKDIQNIVEALEVDGHKGVDLYPKIIHNQVCVTFGGMGIWSAEFSRWLRDKTNIKTVFPMCNTKGRRCTLERIMSVLFHIIHPTLTTAVFPSYASCGNIFNHKNSFHNYELDPSAANNPYALKVWQGR